MGGKRKWDLAVLKNIEALLVGKGVSQRAAARILGISRGAVQRTLKSGPFDESQFEIESEEYPCLVGWFRCECGAGSTLVWRKDDKHCYACHLRKELKRKGA